MAIGRVKDPDPCMEFINAILRSGISLEHLSGHYAVSFVSLRFFSFPFFVSGICHTRYFAFSNFVSLIIVLIIESLVISAYLSCYLSSEQPKKRAKFFFTSHSISRHETIVSYRFF